MRGGAPRSNSLLFSPPALATYLCLLRPPRLGDHMEPTSQISEEQKRRRREWPGGIIQVRAPKLCIWRYLGEIQDIKHLPMGDCNHAWNVICIPVRIAISTANCIQKRANLSPIFFSGRKREITLDPARPVRPQRINVKKGKGAIDYVVVEGIEKAHAPLLSFPSGTLTTATQRRHFPSMCVWTYYAYAYIRHCGPERADG